MALEDTTLIDYMVFVHVNLRIELKGSLSKKLV